uniref:Uncharacterized protein n=1 Tax=Oryza sativa subsp. japonica TaxID=39947 RepID=Q8H5M8_ORYSJ|nr:hypothetical protein [Oryza sativa Japonica Group]
MDMGMVNEYPVTTLGRMKESGLVLYYDGSRCLTRELGEHDGGIFKKMLDERTGRTQRIWMNDDGFDGVGFHKMEDIHAPSA